MPDSDFIATIEAGGQIYSAWESVRVERVYGDFSVFEFTPTENAYGQNYSQLALVPGVPVTINLGGVQVINGFVTNRSVAYDSKSHQVVIAGKSKIEHLRKSSVVVKPGTYDGYTFQQAAQAVMQPHPVNLIMKNPPPSASKPFANLSVQYGETVAEFIQRISMMRGIFIWDDMQGNLCAGAADNGVVADLVEGQNILRAHMVWDNQLAMSVWKSVGQQPGNDQNWPPRAISATGTNSGYPSNWFSLWHAEHPGDAEDMATRVNYEQALAAQTGLQVSATVVGWKKPDGSLWDVGDGVTLLSPMLFPTQNSAVTLYAQSVLYEQDSANGTTTTLNLVVKAGLHGAPFNDVQDVSGAQLPQSATPATPDQPDWKGGSPT
jgi:prophage tail gpP-like protein